MSKEKKNYLWEEHESLLQAVHQRGSGYLLTNSILLTGAIILLSALTTTATSKEGMLFMRSPYAVPLVLLSFFLPLATIIWFLPTSKLDEKSYDRVIQLEKKLWGKSAQSRGFTMMREVRDKSFWAKHRGHLVWVCVPLALIGADAFLIVFLY